MAKRMKGERVMGKRYRVGPAGEGGVSKAVCIHPDIPIVPGDLIQFSDLGDGTFRFWKVGERVARRRRKTVDSRRRRV